MFQDHDYGFPRIGYDLFKPYSKLVGFTTTKNGGASQNEYGGFNLSFATGENPELVTKNRQLIAKGLDIPSSHLVFAYQVHEDNVGIIDDDFIGLNEKEKSIYLQATDAMVTNLTHQCICVLAADCGGVLLYDPVQQVIGAVHAGWRGVSKQITSKAIRKMSTIYGSSPENVLGIVAPCVGVKNYEVGDEVATAFLKIFGENDAIIDQTYPKAHVNIAEANKVLMQDAGMRIENIEMANTCTFDNNDQFYSARRADQGRFCSGIMLV